MKLYIKILMLCGCLIGIHLNTKAHYVTFCGEYVPIEQEDVSKKLMNVIKNWIRTVGGYELRQRANKYFHIFDYYLAAYGVPRDFKYLAVIESLLKHDAHSHAGAHGFWQIMPGTAKDYKLNITPGYDEREDLNKSTDAAARILRDYYKIVYNLTKTRSWILTAASYNNGPGNIKKSVFNSKTTNYFNLQLNKETAEYVYRIVAVKELFEHPEYYMKDFGFNIFSEANRNRQIAPSNDQMDFAFDNTKWKKDIRKKVVEEKIAHHFAARIITDFKNFEDGNLVSIELQESISTNIGFIQKNEIIGNAGYFIDDRLFINLGYGPAYEVVDLSGEKGIAKNELTKNMDILITVTTRNLQ